MAKQTTPGKAPISLAPVKAMSESQPTPSAMPAPVVLSVPAPATQGAAKVELTPVVPKVAEKPAEKSVAAAAPAKPAPVAPVSPAVVKPASATPAAMVAKPVAANPVAAAVAEVIAAKAAPLKPTAPAAVPAAKIAVESAAKDTAKVAITAKTTAEPAGKTVAKAPRAKAPPARTIAARGVGKVEAPRAKIEAPKPAKVASAKSAAVKPTPAKPAPAKAVAAAPVAVAARAVEVAAAARPAATTKPFIAAIEVVSEPVSPWLSQTLALTRAFGVIQAKVLDHACAELKATLGEIETLARTQSAADAVALQTKAFRRGYESLSSHLNDLATTARNELPRL